MEYIGIGICFLSAVTLSWKSENLSSQPEKRLGWANVVMILAGLFFFILGVLGVAFQVPPILPGVRGCIVLLGIFYYALLQARILSIAMGMEDGYKFVNKNTNLYEMTRTAFSFELFPTKGPLNILINFYQFVLFLMVVRLISEVLR